MAITIIARNIVRQHPDGVVVAAAPRHGVVRLIVGDGHVVRLLKLLGMSAVSVVADTKTPVVII